MPDKQFNFFHIFDEASENPRKVSSEENLEKPRENAEKPAQEKMEKKLSRHELLKLLSEERLSEVSLEDFDDFLPEIYAYEERMAGFKLEYEKASDSDKNKIYYKMVNPEIKDVPEYRETALLYVKYLSIKQRTDSVVTKVKKEKAEKRLRQKNREQKNKRILESESGVAKSNTQESYDQDDKIDTEEDSDNDRVDPHTDATYYYNRELRKKR